MYRTQADRMAEAARAQQITEQRIQEIRAKQPAVTVEKIVKELANKRLTTSTQMLYCI